MTNVELVQQALGAIREGDVERARSTVADDFVWQIPGRSPISGEARGIDAWIEKLRTLLSAGLKPEVLDMLEGAEHVAVLQRNTASAGGHTMDLQVVNMFTIRDGRVVRLDTFFGDQTEADGFWSAALGS